MPRVVVDVSYGGLIPGADLVRSRARGALRGVALFVASVRADTIAVVRTGPGWRSLLVLRALLGRRRKLIALHFIVFPDRSRRADRLWARVDTWAIRRALLKGAVLTSEEHDACVARYGLEAERFPLVLWPWRRERSDRLPLSPAEPRVLCSGRAFCDWPTLFAAARGTTWPLTVVCSAEDLDEVRRLNADGRAEVRSEIPAPEYVELLRTASVLAVVMQEHHVSQGHARLMDAADAGVPVVITAARALEEYLVPGETAVVVAPGDPDALRAALARLIDDPDERERMRAAVFARSHRWTGPDYLAAIGELIAAS